MIFKKLNIPVLLRLSLFLVGMHSIILGGIIYFFTVPFYHFFFVVDPIDFFYIRQSGVFLFLAGLFYIIPVKDLKRYRIVIIVTIFSKITAVVFLLRNAHLTPTATIIYLGALGDGTMAVMLSILTLLWDKEIKNSAEN